MTVRFSKKIFNLQLDALKTALANGVIILYSGSQPANPDAAVTGTKIGQIQQTGGTWAEDVATYGLEFNAAAGGSISKASAETWLFTCTTAGTVGWGRFIANTTTGSGSLTTGDSGALDASEVYPRFDFTVGVTSGDLQLGKVTFAIGETAAINTFTLPLSNIA